MPETQTGKLIGIAWRDATRAPMTEVDRIEISADAGLTDDFRGKPGPRQVTVLSVEDWGRACEEVGEELPWTTRRANLLVEGVSLSESVDSLLRIGGVTLQVSFETEPCRRMDEAAAGLCQALTPDWRGGVCCRVIEGGEVCCGDSVEMESAVPGN